MPMRVGEMMVVVRAQDFASRTLRRVSGELNAMSRQSQIVQGVVQRGFRESLGLPKDMRGELQLLQRRNELQSQWTRNMAASTNATFGWSKAGQALGAELAAINRTVDLLDPNVQQLGNSTRGLSQAIKMIDADRLQRVGHSMAGMGRTMQLTGAVGTAAFGMMSNTAADFDTRMSLAATQARDLTGDINQIGIRADQLTNGFVKNGKSINGVLGLMNQYPASANDMADATYEIFSSMNLERNGIVDVAKGLGLLENANQIAVAGNVDLQEATSAMITVLNNFDPQLQNTAENFDTMFDIVRFGRMRISDFNVMMNKVAPAAASAGMSLEDVGGAMAFLTQVMPSQRMVATGIFRLLEALRHPDIVAGLDKMGIKVNDLVTGKMRPLKDILTDIAEGFPQLATGQKGAADFFRQLSALGRGSGRGQMFTSEGRKAIGQLLTHMSQYLERQRQIEENTGEFGIALEAQLKSIGVQWKTFLNQIKAVAIVIGSEAVPAFAKIGAQLEKFIVWFRELDPRVRSFLVQFAVFASIGTLLGGVLLAVLGSFFSLAASLRLLTMNGGAAAGSLGAVLTIMRGLSALGAIALFLKVGFTGEAGAVDFISAAIAGAGIGSIFGPGGAIIGAITLPVTLQLFKTFMDEKSPVEQAYEQYLKDHRKGMNILDKALTHDWKMLFDHSIADVLTDDFTPTGVKSFKEFSKGWEGQARRSRDLLRPLRESGGVDATLTETEQLTQEFEKQVDALEKWYKAQLKGTDTATNRAKELARVTEDATTQALNSLKSMYSQLEQANESAFGTFMQGPFLGGESFNLAKEWGITPRIQDLIRDLTMQNQQFAKWRNMLDKLLKRGLPQDFIDELREMGPEEGLPIMDRILKAQPGQVNRLISQWKRRSKQIQEATKIDFTREIEAFQKAGTDMGEAIINGFQDAGVGKFFDGWIESKFPNLIDAAVNQAVQDWKEQNPAPPKAVPPPKPGNVDNSKKTEINVNQTNHGASAKDKDLRKREAHELAQKVARAAATRGRYGRD